MSEGFLVEPRGGEPWNSNTNLISILSVGSVAHCTSGVYQFFTDQAACNALQGCLLMIEEPPRSTTLNSRGKLVCQFPKLLVAGEVPPRGGRQILDSTILVVV